MKIYKEKLIILSLVILLIFLKPKIGGAMAERPIQDEMQIKVDLSDGVDKKEATIIAKNYLIHKGLDKNVIISRPRVRDSWLNKGYWAVSFPSNTDGIPFPFVVDLDKRTGEVKLAGWAK